MIRLFPRLRNLALASLAAALAMPALAQTAPAAPTGLTGWESATRIVTVQWDDPDDSTITKYQWRNTSLSGSFPAWTDISGSGATTTTATTTTAFPNIWNRRIQVRACAGTTCGNASEVRVDVGQVPIVDVSITSTPRAGDTYTVGETISVAVTWAAWASPDNRGIQLTFSIGANDRTVETTARPRNSGTSAERRGTVTWNYTVVAQDADADGISIGPYPIGLAGRMDFYGGIVTGAGNVGQHQIRNSANHKVDGALGVPAAPTGLAAAEGSGEVTLSWADPQLSSLGGYEVRYAPATDSYPETWTAVPGDASTTEYTVTSLTNETEYKFALRAKNGVGDGAAAEVRATPTAAPLVSDVSFAGTPVARDTYGAGEAVFVDVEFTAPVTVTGSPQLALTVGGNQRQAQMQSASDSTIRFRYIVVAADRDTDGIGIAANALTPNGAAITSAGGDVARLGLRTHAFTANASHKVNGSTATVPTVSAVSITSAPVGGGNTYGGGERIEVEVTFADAVPIIVTGGPRLLIRLAGGPVRATLRRTEGQSLHFGYVVQTGDLDPDGISVAALDLIAGGAIRSHAGTIASLSLGTHAINNAGGHRVVGSSATQPTVTGASITSSPVSGDTYGAGEAIRLEIAFSLDVVVTGSPQATLTIDPGARLSPASYQSTSGNTLTFRYVVQSADRDSNGISLLAVALNSGTIRSLVGANASLALGSHAITNDGDHKTDGRTATVPRVSAVAFASAPTSGDTYGAGEAIEVRIGFTMPVTTTGSPRLALAVGSRTRYAALAGGGSTSELTFSYTAAALDVDTDGVGIGASALELNGGAIRSLAAANALLPLGNLAVANAVDHKVGRPHHGAAGQRHLGDQQPGQRRHLRSRRDDLRAGRLHAGGVGGRRTAVDAHRRAQRTPGALRQRQRHHGPDLQLHRPSGGRGHRRHRHRRRRIDAGGRTHPQRRRRQRRARAGQQHHHRGHRPQGGRPHHGARRRRRDGEQRRGIGQHLRRRRDHRRAGELPDPGDGDRPPAVDVGGRHRLPPGRLRERQRHQDADVPLRSAGQGPRRRRHQRRRQRARPQQRHHPQRRRHQRHVGARHPCPRRPGEPQGGRSHHGADGDRRDDRERSRARRHLRRQRPDRRGGELPAGGDGDWNASAGLADRQHRPPGHLRERNRHEDPDVPLHGADDGHGRQRHQHRRHRVDAQRRHHPQRHRDETPPWRWAPMPSATKPGTRWTARRWRERPAA